MSANTYTVSGWPGVAVRMVGPVTVRDDDYDWTGLEHPDENMVRVVMIGDDHEHIVDRADLVPLDSLDYCAECGQVGCTADGRDREHDNDSPAVAVIVLDDSGPSSGVLQGNTVTTFDPADEREGRWFV